MLVKNVQTDNL